MSQLSHAVFQVSLSRLCEKKKNLQMSKKCNFWLIQLIMADFWGYYILMDTQKFSESLMSQLSNARFHTCFFITFK